MGYKFSIPAGGNAIFEKLRDLVGEPVKTERISLGLSAARLDYFSCGCVRTYIGRMNLGVAEAEEKVSPCATHQEFKSLAGVFRAEPPQEERQG